MSKSSSKFPEAVQACLWSYNIDKIDLRRDRREIITQVLNYGTWDAVKWLHEQYSDDEFREVLLHPPRGRWFKQCLNFWLLHFGIELAEDLRHKALFNLNPPTRAP